MLISVRVTSSSVVLIIRLVKPTRLFITQLVQSILLIFVIIMGVGSFPVLKSHVPSRVILAENFYYRLPCLPDGFQGRVFKGKVQARWRQGEQRAIH